MNRITDKILYELQSRIKRFWSDFTLKCRYGYWCPEYHYPPGESSTRSFDTGLKAREAYYWMEGFLSCYYKIKLGVIAPPRIAPAGKELWIVGHDGDDKDRCINFIYAPKGSTWDEIIEALRPEDWKPNDNDFAIKVEFDRIWYLNSPADTQGEQDGI